MTLGSRGVYEALKKLFVTDKDGHIIVDSIGTWGTVDISDDWTRQLGLVDLSRVLGAALAHTNPVITRISDGTSAFIDPRSIRALLATDLVTADSLTKWGGTPLTGRDISGDLSKLDVALSTKARLQPWYQTNYDMFEEAYSGDGVAPHATTSRNTYTVPANRLAIVSNVHVSMCRATAASTVARFRAAIDVNGDANLIMVWSRDNTIGPGYTEQLGETAILEAGDLLTQFTQDLSTGGTVDYRQGYIVAEFDT